MKRMELVEHLREFSSMLNDMAVYFEEGKEQEENELNLAEIAFLESEKAWVKADYKLITVIVSERKKKKMT